MTKEESFMLEAIKAGVKGMREKKGGPFGCIIVKNNKIISRACNLVTSSNDPTAHAEIVAIRNACKKLKTFQLNDCEIYASCEPCPMCMGAIYWARPAKVFFAASKQEAADAGFDDSFIYKEISLPFVKRKIKMKQIKTDAAKKMFEEWQTINGRKLY